MPVARSVVAVALIAGWAATAGTARAAAPGPEAAPPGYVEVTTAASERARDGDFAGAAALLALHEPRFPGDYELAIGRAYYLLLAGSYADAERAYRRVAALSATRDARLGLADALAGQARWVEVVETLRRDDRVDDDPEALGRVALALYWQGDLGGSRRLYARWGELAPRDAGPEAGLGWCALREGDRRTARRHFESALSRDPALATARDGLRALGPSWQLSPVFSGLGEVFVNEPRRSALWGAALAIDGSVGDLLVVAGRYRHFANATSGGGGPTPVIAASTAAASGDGAGAGSGSGSGNGAGSGSGTGDTIADGAETGQRARGETVGFAQDEAFLSVGLAGARLGLSVLGGVVRYTASSPLAASSAESGELLGVALRVTRLVDVTLTFTESFYGSGNVGQGLLGVRAPLGERLAVTVGAETQAEVGGGAVSVFAAVDLGTPSAWLSLGGHLGREVRPFDPATLAIYNVPYDLRFRAHAAAGATLLETVRLTASYELQALAGESAAETGYGHLFALGVGLAL